MARILVVDDEEPVRELIKTILMRGGHEVETAADGRDGLRMMAGAKFDLIVVDLVMPNMEGTETIQHLRRISDTLPILAITGSGGSSSGRSNAEYLDVADKFGASASLAKPFRNAQLMEAIDALLNPTRQLPPKSQ